MHVELSTCVLFALAFHIPVAEKSLFISDTELDYFNT